MIAEKGRPAEIGLTAECPIDGRPVIWRGRGRPPIYCGREFRDRATEFRAALPEMRANLATWRRMRGAMPARTLARIIADLEADIATAERL